MLHCTARFTTSSTSTLLRLLLCVERQREMERGREGEWSGADVSESRDLASIETRFIRAGRGRGRGQRRQKPHRESERGREGARQRCIGLIQISAAVAAPWQSCHYKGFVGEGEGYACLSNSICYLDREKMIRCSSLTLSTKSAAF